MIAVGDPMRHGIVVVVLLVGCGFETPPGTRPSGGASELWTFNSAATFTAGAALADMTVDVRESREVLTPNAYSYGGLVAHGVSAKALWSTTNVEWSITRSTTPGGVGMWRDEDIEQDAA